MVLIDPDLFSFKQSSKFFQTMDHSTAHHFSQIYLSQIRVLFLEFSDMILFFSMSHMQPNNRHLSVGVLS